MLETVQRDCFLGPGSSQSFAKLNVSAINRHVAIWATAADNHDDTLDFPPCKRFQIQNYLKKGKSITDGFA